MTALNIDVTLAGISDDTAEKARRADELGFDGVWSSETDHDAFLPHAQFAEHTRNVDHGTRVALAFTRSPMVLAYQSWDLQRYSDGRFILGLGTQVKGHNERRFSVEWTPPNPRLREVILALRHIWDVWQGEADELDFQGEHYTFSLMTDTFDPGPIDHPDIPIHIAAINENNIKLAGELCDGLCMHMFSTPSYAEEVIRPTIAEGAALADRSPEAVSLSASPFIVTGETEAEMDERREKVRRRLAFYGSTRTYHDVLAHHGWRDVGEGLHELSKDQRWDEMADLVTDEMLDAFAVEAPLDSLGAELRETYEGIADRVLIDQMGDSTVEQWKRILDTFA